MKYSKSAKAAADKRREAEVKALSEEIENGVRDLYNTPGEYRRYLKMQAKFHDYSPRNVVLIMRQMPKATKVAGFHTWQDVGRFVMKGQKSIRIIAPIVVKKAKEPEEEDFMIFRPTSVFDISQTGGDPLPENPMPQSVDGKVYNFDGMMAAIETMSTAGIRMEDQAVDGLYDRKKNVIRLRSSMSEAQTVLAACHEVAAAKLGEANTDPFEVRIQAQSAACIVCGYYGIDVEDFGFGNVASWSKGRELTELTGSLELVRSTANEMIRGIDNALELTTC